ncbi:MAG: response regulator [Bacteroidales bacterium]|jgi:two-component system OmpR family response regulator|nr:response regulator [Bacteroidales bacterium]
MMSKKIFFVDDDKMIINLLEYTFQSRQQYEVKSFESGEECVAALNGNPDLIVLDHYLSSKDDEKMNGIQTLEKIREINPKLPVVILTGMGSDELSQEFLSKGAAGYLTKDDYFIDSLFDTINKVLK